jgi:hypothetical protein
MRLAGAAGPEQQDVGALRKPAVIGGKRGDLRATDYRHGGEVETVQRLARRPACLEQVSADAPLQAFGQIQLRQPGQQPRRWPALAVGTRGELLLQPGDGRQASLAQEQRQARGVGGDLVGFRV